MAAESGNKKMMWAEAKERLELMEVDPVDVRNICDKESLEFKVVVDRRERTVRKVAITDEEIQMIKKMENDFNFVFYYLIEDEGIWPDGCTFKRYTLPYVGKYEEEYEMDKEDSIKACGTCPAYVVNIEDPDCSEVTEFGFRNIEGVIINES